MLFRSRIIGKSNLLFIIFEEKGEIFGYYFNGKIIEQYETMIEAEKNSFHFNLLSKRYRNPIKFDIRNKKEGGCWLYESHLNELIQIGEMIIYKSDQKEKSYCIQTNTIFDYKSIPHALIGLKPDVFDFMFFNPKRIIVYQMK